MTGSGCYQELFNSTKKAHGSHVSHSTRDDMGCGRTISYEAATITAAAPVLAAASSVIGASNFRASPSVPVTAATQTSTVTVTPVTAAHIFSM